MSTTIRMCVRYCRLVIAGALGESRRSMLSRVLWVAGIGFFALWALLMLLPAPAGAQSTSLNGSFEDLGGNAVGAGFIFTPSAIEVEAKTWVGHAQNMAQTIFWKFFVIELAMIGIQGLLFKGDNLGEFLATYVWKIFVAGFFMWLINESQSIFPLIINSFGDAAQNMTQTNGKELGGLIAIGATAAGLYFGAAELMHDDGETASVLSGMVSPGTSTAVSLGDLLPETCLVALGFLVLASMAVIFMTYIMLITEAFIVMCAGIIFLGFAGTRFTLPWSQGYLQYAVNVGVKQFAFWIVIAIEFHIIAGPIVVSALGGMAAYFGGAGALGGVGTIASLLIFAYVAFEFGFLAVLAFSIPSLAASFMNGTSALSATGAITATLNAFVGARVATSSIQQLLHNGKAEKLAAQMESREPIRDREVRMRHHTAEETTPVQPQAQGAQGALNQIPTAPSAPGPGGAFGAGARGPIVAGPRSANRVDPGAGSTRRPLRQPAPVLPAPAADRFGQEIFDQEDVFTQYVATGGDVDDEYIPDEDMRPVRGASGGGSGGGSGSGVPDLSKMDNYAFYRHIHTGDNANDPILQQKIAASQNAEFQALFAAYRKEQMRMNQANEGSRVSNALQNIEKGLILHQDENVGKSAGAKFGDSGIK